MTDLTHKRRIEIQSILQELSDYWHEYPEQRFGQVVVNLARPVIDPPSSYFNVPDALWLGMMTAANEPPERKTNV